MDWSSAITVAAAVATYTAIYFQLRRDRTLREKTERELISREIDKVVTRFDTEIRNLHGRISSVRDGANGFGERLARLEGQLEVTNATLGTIREYFMRQAE